MAHSMSDRNSTIVMRRSSNIVALGGIYIDHLKSIVRSDSFRMNHPYGHSGGVPALFRKVQMGWIGSAFFRLTCVKPLCRSR